LAGATLNIPPGAVSANGSADIQTASSPIAANLGVDGTPETTKPVYASAGQPISFQLKGATLVHPVTLTFSVDQAVFAQAADAASNPEAVWLASYDAVAKRWTPVHSQYNPGTRTVTALVAHLSTWNAFTWDWAGMLVRFRQMLSAFGTGRAPTISCPKTEGTSVTMAGGNDPPLIGCVTGDAASGFKVEITSNRSYSMVLRAPPGAVQAPQDYAGFEQYVETRDLATKAIGGTYLSSVHTVTYTLPPAGAAFKFTGSASIKTEILDLAAIASEAFFDTFTLGYASCVLDSVAHSGAATLNEAPGLIAECFPGLNLVVDVVAMIQTFQNKIANILAGFDTALDAFRNIHGEVDVTRSLDWYNTSYISTCGGAAPHPFTVTVQNGKSTASGGPQDPQQHYDMQIEAVQRGDLTGGGKSDTAVLIYCAPQPSNFYLEDVQVFGPDGNLLAELPHVGTLTPSGSPLPPQYVPSELSIRGGQLIAGMKFYAPTDSHAGGPSLHGTLTWKWNGHQFVLQPPGISNILPVTDVTALLQQLAMQDCQSTAVVPGGCTPGGAKISSIDPRYGIGIADAIGHHGTIYMRPSATSTAFTSVMSLGGDLPTCSQVQAAGVPADVFTELVGQACLNV
jgi:hypothetical protein